MHGNSTTNHSRERKTFSLPSKGRNEKQREQAAARTRSEERRKSDFPSTTNYSSQFFCSVAQLRDGDGGVSAGFRLHIAHNAQRRQTNSNICCIFIGLRRKYSQSAFFRTENIFITVHLFFFVSFARIERSSYARKSAIPLN